MAEFPVDHVRAAFPALQDDFIFFDNAAGAQSPQTVLNAVANHLLHRNVQRGGRYRQSQEVDEAIAQARASVALLVNARHPDEISFGMNATSFMRLISIAIGQSLKDRREIIVTDLDHEANIAVYTPDEERRRADIFRRIRDIEAGLRHRHSSWPEQMAAWEERVRGDQPDWTVVEEVIPGPVDKHDDAAGPGRGFLPRSPRFNPRIGQYRPYARGSPSRRRPLRHRRKELLGIHCRDRFGGGYSGLAPTPAFGPRVCAMRRPGVIPRQRDPRAVAFLG